MRRISNTSRSAWTPWLGAALLALSLGLHALPGTPIAQGEIKESPRPEAFRSGAERSEIVLREIHETLRRIDARLERFERALRQAEAEEGRGEDRAAAAREDGQTANDR